MSEKGLILKKCLIAGSNSLLNDKEYVNSLNVFPVPDGDTGTNMSLTLESCVKEINKVTDITVNNIAKAAANGSLMGARGNSGVITSQMLRGFYKGLEAHNDLSIEALKDAFVECYKTAYRSVMKPTEGTMLTVARIMGEFAEEHYLDYEEAKDFVQDIIIEGNQALKQTQFQLKELEEAGVVDAGGQGIMTILTGALNYQGIRVEAPVKAEVREEVEFVAADNQDIEFGYCTEFKIMGDDSRYESFRDQVSNLGDSIIVVPGEGFIKVHLHTNQPGLALEKAMRIGSLTDIKIDNMREQHRHQMVTEDEVKKAQAKESQVDLEKYGFIAISTGQGLNHIFKELMVNEVITGGQTMNPSTEDILSAIDRVAAENIFVFPNNKNIILAAEQAKTICEEENRTKKVHIVPTRTIPEAFTALLSFDESAGADENLENMKEAMAEVTTGQVTYAVRDTKIGETKVSKDDVIGLSRDKILAVGKKINKVTLDLIQQLVTEEDSMIAVYYGDNIDERSVEDLNKKLNKAYPDYDIDVMEGSQPLYYYIFSIE